MSDNAPASCGEGRMECGVLSKFGSKGGGVEGVPSIAEFKNVDGVGRLESSKGGRREDGRVGGGDCV